MHEETSEVECKGVLLKRNFIAVGAATLPPLKCHLGYQCTLLPVWLRMVFKRLWWWQLDQNEKAFDRYVNLTVQAVLPIHWPPWWPNILWSFDWMKGNFSGLWLFCRTYFAGSTDFFREACKYNKRRQNAANGHKLHPFSCLKQKNGHLSYLEIT